MSLAIIVEFVNHFWLNLALALATLVYVRSVVAIAKWIGRHEDWISDMSDSDEDI